MVKSGVSAPMFSIHGFPTIRSGVKDTEVSLSGLFKYSVSLALIVLVDTWSQLTNKRADSLCCLISGSTGFFSHRISCQVLL